LTYSEEGLEAAKQGADKLASTAFRDDSTGGKGEALDAEPYRKRFIEAMDDDFNTAQAIGALFELARDINRAGDAGVSIAKAQGILVSLGREVLGLRLESKNQNIVIEVPTLRLKITTYAPTVIIEPASTRINRLVEERMKCRKDKNWQRADEIRNRLAELGVELEDTKAGTDVTYKSVPSEEALDKLLKELGITL
jgi:cysteinyl-tRNA synthetase